MIKPDRLVQISRLKGAVVGVMDIDGYEFHANNAVSLRGRLVVPLAEAMQLLEPRFAPLGYTPHFEASGTDYTLIAVPGVAPRMREVVINPRLNVYLFLATLASVTLTGGLEGATIETLSFNLPNGLMFAATLMSILVAHEMGHYVVGRLRGAKTSWPLFLPLPLISLGGTLGAVIVQQRPFKDRRTLLEVGVAGPLAGFVLAVPLFLLGLYLTNGTPQSVPAGSSFLGDSLLTQVMGLSMLGNIYVSTTESIVVHPVAFAAWIGLLITGINLLPAGQLDGGHIMYALLGEKARYVSYAVIAAMIALAFVSEAWILWAFLLFLFGRTHPPVEDVRTPLGAMHYLLAVAGILVFVLTFVPRPLFMT